MGQREEDAEPAEQQLDAFEQEAVQADPDAQNGVEAVGVHGWDAQSDSDADVLEQPQSARESLAAGGGVCDLEPSSALIGSRPHGNMGSAEPSGKVRQLPALAPAVRNVPDVQQSAAERKHQRLNNVLQRAIVEADSGDAELLEDLLSHSPMRCTAERRPSPQSGLRAELGQASCDAVAFCVLTPSCRRT